MDQGHKEGAIWLGCFLLPVMCILHFQHHKIGFGPQDSKKKSVRETKSIIITTIFLVDIMLVCPNNKPINNTIQQHCKKYMSTFSFPEKKTKKNESNYNDFF